MSHLTIMGHGLREVLLAMDAIYPVQSSVPSIPCPCGSGVIEDDCTCEDTAEPARCGKCGGRIPGDVVMQDECWCCQECQQGICEVCEV